MAKDACYRKVKARYKVFPSAYASGAIAKCRKVGASNWGNKAKKKKWMAVRKTAKGAALRRWFKEDWKDVRSGKPCGRQKGEKRGTPYCRPSKRVSSKTPVTSGELSANEKRTRIAQKKRIGQPAGKPRRVKAIRRKKWEKNIRAKQAAWLQRDVGILKLKKELT